MLFYYIQIKDSHDPGVNIREKARVASINKAEGSSGGGGGEVEFPIPRYIADILVIMKT